MSSSFDDSEAFNTAAPSPRLLRYSTVTGYFAQSEPDTDSNTFDWTKSAHTGTSLGLIKREYDSDQHFPPGRRGWRGDWQRFEYHVNWTNDHAEENVAYKIFFMGRHGEGWHNVAEAEHGTPDWNDYYSKQENWTDARLTPTGYAQAQEAGAFWENALKHSTVVAPQSYYVSPLARCLATAMLTYSRLELPKWRPFRATVKELLREVLGVHTCDKRSSRTWISNHFNAFNIEPGFTENDELWSPDVRETKKDLAGRMKVVLDDIFSNDNHTFISFTSHSGSIASILEVIGHRPFPLKPGEIIAVYVKAERVGDSPFDDIKAEVAPSTGDPVPVSAEEAQFSDEEALRKAGLVFGSTDGPAEIGKAAGVYFESD